MRPLWKGAISFGLVHIPVRLYAATARRALRFRWLHGRCRTPIRYRKWCPNCETEVAGEDLVSGYEYERDRFVLIGDDDLAALPGFSRRTVEILDFVRLAEIDPVYYEKNYFLEPADGGHKAYHLLRQVMRERDRVAVARVAIRDKETLAALRGYGDVLALSTMFWPDEVRSAAGLEGPLGIPELKPAELEMALTLVDNLTHPFTPGRYLDRRREALQELVLAKVEGRQVFEYREPATAEVVDLLEALRASVDMTQGDGDGAPLGAED
ncbi:MAG: Ku protein [bacterium]|nr:Ku protein [bacterium]